MKLPLGVSIRLYGIFLRLRQSVAQNLRLLLHLNELPVHVVASDASGN
jgi:hypothetical protein